MATELELSMTPPYAAGPALALLAAHTIPGAEITDVAARTHSRLITGPSGPIKVTLHIEADAITAVVDCEIAGEVAALRPTLRSWLDLDCNPAEIESALGADPILGPLLISRPGLRVIGHPERFEALVLTVLGQQVSLAAARTFGSRLVAAFGTSHPSGLTQFPAPALLASVPAEELRDSLGLTGARARSVAAVARACATGEVALEGNDHAGLRAQLLDLPGVGPWTVDYFTVRALGDRDAFTPGDLVLRRALGVADAKKAAALAAGWSPYRAYALLHLWTQAAYD